MPCKRQKGSFPKDAQIIQFEPGEMKPLFVKAANIERVFIGLTPKTLANWRGLGTGPKYLKVGSSVYYALSELESYFWKNQVETTN